LEHQRGAAWTASTFSGLFSIQNEGMIEDVEGIIVGKSECEEAIINKPQSQEVNSYRNSADQCDIKLNRDIIGRCLT